LIDEETTVVAGYFELGAIAKLYSRSYPYFLKSHYNPGEVGKKNLLAF